LAKIIAIDGPAGSGKSTVAKLVSLRLGFTYVDTGAMYRAITLKAVKEGLDLNNEKALIDLASRTHIDINTDENNRLLVLLDNENAEDLIRTPELTAKVKYLARVDGVRKYMVDLQRKIGEQKDCVFEGRDITTVVFPDTKYKFYLDADVKERAKRRLKDFKDPSLSLEEVEKDIEQRDLSDKNRNCGALRIASDAVLIDTTEMNIEEVADRICSYIK